VLFSILLIVSVYYQVAHLSSTFVPYYETPGADFSVLTNLIRVTYDMSYILNLIVAFL